MLFLKNPNAFRFVFIPFLLICFIVYEFNFFTFSTETEPLEAMNVNENTLNYASQLTQTTEISPHFIEVEKGTLLYSAWFDDRNVQTYIQVLLMTSRRKQPPSLSCRFQNGKKCASTEAVTPYYEINGRYSNKRYGMFVASCVLPKDLISIPSFVDISVKVFTGTSNESIVLPLGNTRKNKTSKIDYGICIAPLFGHIQVSDLIEFLELSQLLGASYFTFYDFEISDNVKKVLNYYRSKGVAQVLSWKLPSYITQEDVHYFGQIFAMQDCLFRSINHLNFVAFNDLDEFIVPLRHDSMPSLLHSIHESKYAGHCFRSTYFPRLESANTTMLPFTQNVLRRSSKADTSHTKCVDDPERVFEHGVHLIMQPFKGYESNDVSWNEARVFHYRSCPPPCHLPTDMEVDTTMQKYGHQLKKTVATIITNSKVHLE